MQQRSSLGSDALVISAHFDDAVFSIGAAIHASTKTGSTVRILTVFGDDPESSQPANPWDRRTGFVTEGEAVHARAEEDRLACKILGATRTWLPYRDAGYGGEDADDSVIWADIEKEIAGRDSVLVPGFPLTNEDHFRLARMFVQRSSQLDLRIGFYVEQPYVVERWPWVPLLWPWRARLDHRLQVQRGRERWTTLRASRRDRLAKKDAMRAYGSQFAGFVGRPNVIRRIALYESIRGGERLLWLDDRKRQPSRYATTGGSP